MNLLSLVLQAFLQEIGRGCGWLAASGTRLTYRKAGLLETISFEFVAVINIALGSAFPGNNGAGALPARKCLCNGNAHLMHGSKCVSFLGALCDSSPSEALRQRLAKHVLSTHLVSRSQVT